MCGISADFSQKKVLIIAKNSRETTADTLSGISTRGNGSKACPFRKQMQSQALHKHIEHSLSWLFSCPHVSWAEPFALCNGKLME